MAKGRNWDHFSPWPMWVKFSVQAQTMAAIPTIGQQTFSLNKTEYTAKLTRILNNFRANSRLIGEPREFILRSCRLTETWQKLAKDPEVSVHLRNVEIAGGRKVKMISLERGSSRQPVSKSKLVDVLYPAKKIATTATPEEKHYNAVKAAMRNGVKDQLKQFRDGFTLPAICYLSGRNLRRGMKTDVDHVGVSFAEIADSFVSMKGMTYTDFALIGPPTAKRFKDEPTWKEWQEYHHLKAKFALVCASANRSKGSDGYATPSELYGSFSAKDSEDLALDF